MLVLNRKTTGASPETLVAPFAGILETIVVCPSATSSEHSSVRNPDGVILEIQIARREGRSAFHKVNPPASRHFFA